MQIRALAPSATLGPLLLLCLFGSAAPSSSAAAAARHQPVAAALLESAPRSGEVAGFGRRNKAAAPAVTEPAGGKSAAKNKIGRGKNKKQDATATEVVSVRGGSASMSNMILNLIKAVVGVGVLSLSAGIASFGSAPGAVAPAMVLVALMGLASGYGFSLIGRVCAYTGAMSYRDAWDRTVGTDTSWIVAATCTGKSFAATLAYSMGLADTSRSILLSLGFDFTRTSALLVVTTLFLLPLCMLKNLSALAPFSLLGILAMIFAGGTMGLRYFGGGYAAPDGKFLADVATEFQPKFGSGGVTSVFQPGSFVFVCMLSTAFMAHFNAPKFYRELKDNTIERFNTLVTTSFGASVLIQAFIAAVGFLTFGTATSGLVLNNYSTKDALMGLTRIAIAFSVVFTFPIPFAGCRDGVLDLMKVPAEKRTDAALLNAVTVALLGLVTAVAIKVTDLSFILSFGGATLGNALIYIFPGLMFRGAVRGMGEGASMGLRREVGLGMAFAALGVVLGSMGAVMAIKGAGSH